MNKFIFFVWFSIHPDLDRVVGYRFRRGRVVCIRRELLFALVSFHCAPLVPQQEKHKEVYADFPIRMSKPVDAEHLFQPLAASDLIF